MLNKLSVQDEKDIKTIRDKWIGLANRSYKPEKNSSKLLKLVERTYKLMNKKPPFFIVLDSPLHLQIAANLWGSLFSDVTLENNNTVQQYRNVAIQGTNKEISVKSIVNQIYSQIYAQGNITYQLNDKQLEIKPKYIPMMESCLTGDSGWVSFYDYFIGKIKYEPKTLELFEFYKDLIVNLGYFTCWFENAVLTCDYPKVVHFNDKNQVHNENGPAYEWDNGESYYCLNGVPVPKWFITKPLADVTNADIMGISNVDERREFIRKIGIDVFISKTGAQVLDHKVVDVPVYETIHNQHCMNRPVCACPRKLQAMHHLPYDLLQLDLSPEIKGCKYLKMKNPSIGTWHVEGVARECNTVQEAINWRAGDIKTDWIPDVLT